MKNIKYLITLLFIAMFTLPVLVDALDVTSGANTLTVETDSSRGLVAADFNGDGNTDVYVANRSADAQDEIYFGDGLGDFTVGVLPVDTGAEHDVVSFDFEGDGDIDLYLGNAGGTNRILVNDGSGVFTAVNIAGDGGTTYGVAAADVDGDGDDDLYTANVGAQNKLWINDGAGNFTANDIAGDSGNTADGLFVDVDGDGDMDLYTVNFGTNKLWINDGAGNFTANDIAGDGGNTYGAITGDVDGDGDMDLYTATQGAQNKLWINDGAGNFTANDIAGDTGSSQKAAFGDLDFDGDLDLYVANNGQNKLWINDGTGSFMNDDIAGDLLDSHAVVILDIDGDDSNDIYVANAGPANTLWINNEEAPVVSSSPSRSSGSGIRYVCKDKDASNYNPTRFGRHKAARCKYAVLVEIDKNNNSMNPFKGERCAEDQIISDFMKNGDENGKYSTYNNGVVTQVSILQAHINRLLSDEYTQAAGPIDKWFGIQTKKGVERLQQKLNMLMPNKTPLFIDGIVGPRTQVALNNSCNIDSE